MHFQSSESKTDSSSDAETDMDETDPYAVIKALRRQLDKKDKKIKAQEVRELGRAEGGLMVGVTNPI